MYTALQKITDGTLASASVYSANEIVVPALLQNSGNNNLIIQLVLPIVTGFLVPFLKDLAINLKNKRRAKKGLTIKK